MHEAVKIRAWWLQYKSSSLFLYTEHMALRWNWHFMMTNYLQWHGHGSHIFVIICICARILLYEFLWLSHTFHEGYIRYREKKRKGKMIRCLSDGYNQQKELQKRTLGGTKAASLFLLFSAVFSNCFSCFSCHFFACFFLSLKKYSPVSSCISSCRYHIT